MPFVCFILLSQGRAGAPPPPPREIDGKGSHWPCDSCGEPTYEGPFTDAALDVRLEQLAGAHFGANRRNGLRFSRQGKVKKVRGGAGSAEIFRCAFFNECDCPWRLEVRKNDNSDWSFLRVGCWLHDHSRKEKHTKFTSPSLMQSFSPSKAHMSIREEVSALFPHGVNHDFQKKIKRKMSELRSMDRLGGDVTPAEARTFGGLHGYLESRTSLFCSSRVCRVFNPCYTKPRVLHAPPGTFAQLSKQPNFNANTMYVVGAPLLDSGELVPPEKPGKKKKEEPDKSTPKKKKPPKQFNGRVAFLISTDNLLLNGWRAAQFSNGIQLGVDATYRLVVEGHGVLVLCVADLAQVTHVLGYGIFSHEDETGIRHILTQLKYGVEAVTARYAENGWQG